MGQGGTGIRTAHDCVDGSLHVVFGRRSLLGLAGGRAESLLSYWESDRIALVGIEPTDSLHLLPLYPPFTLPRPFAWR